MLESKRDIREHYRRADVASQYIEERFQQPIGGLVHARQVAAMTELVSGHDPKIMLDLAAGPARVSVDLARVVRTPGIVLDSSDPMIRLARERLSALGDQAAGW